MASVELVVGPRPEWLGISVPAVAAFLKDCRAAGVTLDLVRLNRYRLIVAVPLDKNKLVQLPHLLADLDRATATALPVWRRLQKARVHPTREHTAPGAVIAADLGTHRTTVRTALAVLADLELIDNVQDRELVGVVRGGRKPPTKQPKPVREIQYSGCAKTDPVRKDRDARPTQPSVSLSSPYVLRVKPGPGKTIHIRRQNKHTSSPPSYLTTRTPPTPSTDATSRAALLAYRLDQLDPEHLEHHQLDPVLYETAATYFDRTDLEHLEPPESEPELDLTIRDPDIAALIAAELARPIEVMPRARGCSPGNVAEGCLRSGRCSRGRMTIASSGLQHVIDLDSLALI